jgi:hypothetical protein
MTYTWQVINLITRTETSSDGVSLPEAVVNVHWRRSGVDGDGNTASINGYAPLDASSIVTGDFIGYNDLTEDTVTTWLDTVNAEFIEDYNAKIVAKIAKTGEVTKAVPWS